MAMAVELNCKEPGCTETVSYEKKTIPALAASIGEERARGSIDVYLECPKGHLHRYTIRENREDSYAGAANK